MADTTLFVITPTKWTSDPVPLRLIRAESQKQLRKFLLEELNIAPASADDAFRAAQAGVVIESACGREDAA